MPVEFKKVKRGPKEEFLWTGMTAAINGSSMYFCKKCTGIWNSHDYPAGENGRARPRHLRSCCIFCKSEVQQQLLLRSTQC